MDVNQPRRDHETGDIYDSFRGFRGLSRPISATTPLSTRTSATRSRSIDGSTTRPRAEGKPGSPHRCTEKNRLAVQLGPGGGNPPIVLSRSAPRILASIPQSIGIARMHRQKTPRGHPRIAIFCNFAQAGSGTMRAGKRRSAERKRSAWSYNSRGSAAGPNPGQGCSGYLVESGTTQVVIDLGSGNVSRTTAARRLPPA